MDFGNAFNIPAFKFLETLVGGGETSDALREGAKAGAAAITPLSALNNIVQQFLPEGPLKDIVNVVLDPLGALATALWPPRDGTKLGDGYATAGDPRNADALKHLTTLAGKFHEIDQKGGLFGYADGLIGKPELEALANDPNCPADLREAAQFFLDNPDLLQKLDAAAGIGGVDGKIGMEDFLSMMAELQAGTARAPGESADEHAARPVPPAPVAPTPLEETATPEAGFDGPAVHTPGMDKGEPADGTGKVAPKLAEDRAALMEEARERDAAANNSRDVSEPQAAHQSSATGITERISQKAESLWDEIDKLSRQLEDATEPGQIQKLSTKLNRLQSQMQMLTSMLSAVQQLTSNLSKMMHDVQMNTIRNTR